VAAAALLLAAAPAAGAASPALRITSTVFPSRLAPGDSIGSGAYLVRVTNVGAAPTDGSPITIADSLPAGVTLHPGPGAIGSLGLRFDGAPSDPSLCQPAPPVSCSTLDHATSPEGIPPVLEPDGYLIMVVPVDVAAPALEGSTAVNEVSVSGGGASPASATEDTLITAAPAPFGLQDSSFSLTDAAGDPAIQAGSHPYDLNTRFLITSVHDGAGVLVPAASLRDLHIDLPRGLLVDPRATPVRCTEAQLESLGPSPGEGPACPDASAVGIARTSAIALGQDISSFDAAVYNMVPPPGAPAEFGFVIGAGPIFVHLLGGLDPAGDYRLTASARQLPQFGAAVGVDLDIWGDPSAPSHDAHRGACADVAPAGGLVGCPVAADDTPFLTMPSSCSGPLRADIAADSYEEPGNFLTASAESAGPVVGCSALAFAPTLKARPTIDAADSPTGLSVDLHIPQTTSKSQLATANLRKTVVTLPEGLVANPAAANGLGACPAAAISAHPPSCPDASKVGTVEIDTPLLPDPLSGSVYVAAPHNNPLGALFVLYALVDDPQSGIAAAVAGEIDPDPQSGRLRAVFDDLPQIPISDVKLELYDGPRGLLTTPASCGTYSTASTLTPWSGAAPATLADGYSIQQGPGPGCQEGSQATPPSFEAGTVAPLAGAGSPFVLDLRRERGAPEFGSLELTTPPGLSASLAAVGTCGETELAVPSPHCPADSRVGGVVVQAGSGPQPLPLTGDVYLAGPHSGAPFSLAVIVPARAGPFDLGSLLVRIAVSVDPRTAQLHLQSDPLPRIVSGIPIDLRRLEIRLDRPGFVRNPTSCDEMAVTGTLTSSSETNADLFNRFQIGGCRSLGLQPRVSLRFSGALARNGRPALRVLARPRPGDSNLSRAVLGISGELIAPAGLRAVCTRGDFATQSCPVATIRGWARVWSPLLERPLQGRVYLRESTGRYPDLAVDLGGRIDLELIGHISARNATLEVSFNSLPDIPLSRLELILKGGRRGLLANSEGLCHYSRRASIRIVGHNGILRHLRPKVTVACQHSDAQRSRPNPDRAMRRA
jgi:hypothetical protein